ncbi:hypothetical protein [Microbulbifer sp. GL-2]|uniref:hypothetical protein n=1 Tax=Microbulbifer sp. GL-2 TaxID=2591606 RepID=UPI0011647179|nr:hypothetical protein [Microbulbifer sp. GL-2]BBM02717.1 hypothetical protein GL2_27910 [Microbulbifer sp. GL-2]
MNVLLIIGAVAILVALYRAATSKNIPQSPAACGIAFFTVTAGLASWLYLLSAIPFHSLYLLVSVTSLPLILLLGGVMAARTSEDTASMNAKIVLAVAAVPYLLVTFIAFMNSSEWAIIYALVIYIPCIIGGRYIGSKYLQVK